MQSWRDTMHYYEDPQIALEFGSKDCNVLPRAQPNEKDNYVRDLQQDLNALGYTAGKADGWFGTRTMNVVRNFQADARDNLRCEQDSALGPGRRFAEAHPVYVGGVTGVVDTLTAGELQRWKQNRWQKPRPVIKYQQEDIRDRLPVNSQRNPRIRPLNDIERIVLHCTDAQPGWGAFQCAQYDIKPNHISQRGCPTITYAYFVNADGLVQKCLSRTVVSWHVGNWNYSSLAVVLAYRATGNQQPPPPAQIEAVSALFARICQQLTLDPRSNIVGHRELLGTGYHLGADGKKSYRKSCPGWKVDLDEFRQETGRLFESLTATAI
ncbi:MAG: hypothetical protein B6I22_10235 [Desulfobacteraceae bacterium 4572_123]|nr:MAG: hypothetical protein B6I22_10235 [Desulfobacteraceae bacterium 4572_123]